MKCCNCKYYEENPSFNECKLLKWECCRVQNDCKCVNDDGTINKEEFDKDMEHM